MRPAFLGDDAGAQLIEKLNAQIAGGYESFVKGQNKLSKLFRSL